MKTTITEALADIKTSLARIEKKRAQVVVFLGRDSRLRDPMEKEGGSAEFVRRERQSIKDLQEKIVKIRSAIQAANLSIKLTIEGTERTLSEWLNWRREISENEKKHLQTMSSHLATLRQRAIQQGQRVTETAPDVTMTGDLIVAVSEVALAEEIDKMENVLGQLDGRLSLLNATTTIDY